MNAGYMKQTCSTFYMWLWPSKKPFHTKLCQLSAIHVCLFAVHREGSSTVVWCYLQVRTPPPAWGWVWAWSSSCLPTPTPTSTSSGTVISTFLLSQQKRYRTWFWCCAVLGSFVVVPWVLFVWWKPYERDLCVRVLGGGVTSGALMKYNKSHPPACRGCERGLLMAATDTPPPHQLLILCVCVSACGCVGVCASLGHAYLHWRGAGLGSCSFYGQSVHVSKGFSLQV